jgi:hypothetical protein
LLITELSREGADPRDRLPRKVDLFGRVSTRGRPLGGAGLMMRFVVPLIVLVVVVDESQVHHRSTDHPRCH